jgi:hypothetical protein
MAAEEDFFWTRGLKELDGLMLGGAPPFLLDFGGIAAWCAGIKVDRRGGDGNGGRVKWTRRKLPTGLRTGPGDRVERCSYLVNICLLALFDKILKCYWVSRKSWAGECFSSRHLDPASQPTKAFSASHTRIIHRAWSRSTVANSRTLLRLAMRNPADSPATNKRPKTMPKAMDNFAVLLPREPPVESPEDGGVPAVAVDVTGADVDDSTGVEDDVESVADNSAAAVITSAMLMRDERSSHAPRVPLPSQNANACRTPMASMRVCNSATADAALL